MGWEQGDVTLNFPRRFEQQGTTEAGMLFEWIRRIVIATAGLFLTAGTASAHHFMGGVTPSTFAEGFLSGLAHPIIDAEHLAFLVGLGIAVGAGGLSLVNVGLFLAAMACGVAVHLASVSIPASEMTVAASALVAGMLIAWGRFIHAVVWMVLFAVGGFFHGYAYGESIYGAESSPVTAYLIGLVVVQSALAVAIALPTRGLGRLSATVPRLAGAAIVGVGVTVLLGQVLKVGW